MQIIDITQSAVGRVRLLNGARAIGFAGLLFLLISPITALEGDWWTTLLLASVGGLLVVAGGHVKRASRLAALISSVVFVAMLLPRVVWMGPLELAIIVGLGFFIVQGVRGAFALGAAQRAPRTPVRHALFVRLAKPRKPAIVTGLTGAAAVAFLGGLLLLARRISALQEVLQALEELARQSLGMQYLIDGVGLGLIALSSVSYRTAKRHLAASALQVRTRDNRPPILLLRSFDDDMIGVVQEYRLSVFRRASQSFEEVLTENLWDYGPVIAIGRPGESIPPLGAAREYVTNQDWQTRVGELSASAQMIFLVVGRTEGVRWEIRTIIAAGLLPKTVLIFPPIQHKELESRWNDLARELGHAQVPDVLPIGKTLLFLFSERAEPLCVIGKRRRSNYYREAIDVGAAVISRGRAA